MAYEKRYGYNEVKQPGGGPNARVDNTAVSVRNPERSYKVVTAPCRLGPANKGGNKPTAGMKNRQGR